MCVLAEKRTQNLRASRRARAHVRVQADKIQLLSRLVNDECRIESSISKINNKKTLDAFFDAKTFLQSRVRVVCANNALCGGSELRAFACTRARAYIRRQSKWLCFSFCCGASYLRCSCRRCCWETRARWGFRLLACNHTLINGNREKKKSSFALRFFAAQQNIYS